MEFRLGSILIESALKIGSLADSVDVLVIVDTPAGRLFSGKGGLVGAFLSSTLSPSPNDVQLHVDPDVIPAGKNPCVVPEQTRNPATNASQNLFKNNFSTRKRQSSDSSNSSLAKMKKGFPAEPHARVDSRPLTNETDFSNVRLSTDEEILLSQTQTSAIQSCDQTVKPSQILLHSQIGNSFAQSFNFPTKCVKTEFDESLASQGQELIELSSGDKSSTYVTLTGGRQIAQSNLSKCGADYCVNTSDLTVASFAGDVTMDDVISAVNNAVPPIKLEAFGTASGELVSVRGSVENRLASSLAYDAGKALADLKPISVGEMAAKSFFNRHFEAWVMQFDNLRGHLKTMIPNGKPELGQTFTLLALLKMTARAAFKQKLKSRAKR